MTKTEKTGVSGARSITQSGVRLLRQVETGLKTGNDAVAAVAKAKELIRSGLSLLDDVSVPKDAAREAKAEVAAKIERKNGAEKKTTAKKSSKKAVAK